jgi:hypothetical protein
MKMLLTSIVGLTFAASVAASQTVVSATATRNLLEAMEQAGLEAIATVDPTEAGAFVAALHIKGGQLLVVRAHHPSVEALSARVAAGQFRDAYIDLQATPPSQGKWFLMDTGADGLPDPSDDAANVDVMYEDGTRQTMFNGARAQKLSASAYAQKLMAADADYSRLLKLLTAAAEQAKRP